MIRKHRAPLAMGSVALGIALAAASSAWSASLPAGSKRTNVKIETADSRPESAAGIGAVPLTPGSLAPAQAIEVRPYVAIPDTNDTHTQRVWTHRTGK